MTDHVHNQLCARIEELEKEKLELNEQLDVAQQERDALAAHLDRIKTILGEGVDVIERSGELAWSVCPDEVSEWENSEPAVSLSRLKSQWQSEAVSEFAFHHLGGHEQEVAEIYASRLRRQAGGDA